MSKSAIVYFSPRLPISPTNRSHSRTMAILSETLAGLHVSASNLEAPSDPDDDRQEDAAQESDKPIASLSGLKRPPRPPSKAILQDFILESLSFKSMNYREQDIEQAHGSSFDWIFTDQTGDSHPSFSDWLSTNNLGNIYWSRSKHGLMCQPRWFLLTAESHWKTRLR